MKDDVTFINGSHTVKTGFTYDRQQANGFGQQDYGGRAGFSFLHTGLPGITNFATAGGSSFASFLLGYANTGRTETIRYLQQIYPYYGFYAQDDWRMNDKLVLNYGVRYEFTRPPVAGGDQYSDFDPDHAESDCQRVSGRADLCRRRAGREGTSEPDSTATTARVAPRLSGAYSLNSKTTIRGGVGRSFGRVTVISGHEPLRRVYRAVPVSQRRLRRHADVPARSGHARVSASAADQSVVLEQPSASTTGTATRR